MTDITFNDGAAAVLSNTRPVPFDRFSEWVPDTVDIGPLGVPVGTGVTNVFILRTDYVARTELRNIPDTVLPIAVRLKRHLERGGTVTLNTGDAGHPTYTARIRPGTQVSIEPNDAQRRLFTVKIEFKNTAAADLLCEY
jgi:hypothetical protein